MKILLPKGEQWFTWRLVTSPRLKETKRTIEDDWTWEEARQANKVLDEVDRCERELSKRKE